MSGYHSMVLRYQTQMEVPGYKPMDLTGHMLHDDNGDIDRRPTTTKECYHCDSVMSHGFLACQPSYRLLLFSLSLPLPPSLSQLSLSLYLFALLCSGVRATGSPCGPLVRATPLILKGWARLYNIWCPNVVFPRMGSLFARHR